MATPPPRIVVAKVPLPTVNTSASASAPLASCDHVSISFSVNNIQRSIHQPPSRWLALWRKPSIG
jgi:hypothetical protein